MATTPTDPSVGLNAETGGTITGWQHVMQSVQDIMATSFGVRVMREYYGSFVPVVLGRENINASGATLFMSAVASALMQWEPRFAVTAIRVNDATRGGALSLTIEGEYRPRATYGDLSSDGSRRIIVSSAAAGGGNWITSEG